MGPRGIAMAGTTALGFTPALIGLVLAGWMQILFGWTWTLVWPFRPTPVLANNVANLAMLGLLAAAYTVWILAVARRWITSATGGGFVIAAYALCLRIMAEHLVSLLQLPLAETAAPEPYARMLPLARGTGLVMVVAGLALVVAAVVTERRLRRVGPAWAVPP